MKNGTIVFKSEQIPEKNLLKILSYSYHPASDMKADIIEDVKKNLKCDLDGYTVGVEVVISLKQYGQPDSKFWYDKTNNDTENS